MKPTYLCLFITLLGACGGNDDSPAAQGGDPAAQALPVTCQADSDCPNGVGCVGLETADTGHCDVAEIDEGQPPGPTSDATADGGSSGDMPVSSALPVMCQSDDDCPEGIACVNATAEGPGHCDVSDVVVEPSPGEDGGDAVVSLGVPAPCTTDDDCPEGVSCTGIEEGIGFCDVAETQVGSGEL